MPDETTICKFRHLLERRALWARRFKRVQAHLQSQGLKINTGMIVDATIINAPNSTKNQQQRDLDMHQIRKDQQWHFGVEAHVGVDSKTKLIHSGVATATTEADGRGAGGFTAWR